MKNFQPNTITVLGRRVDRVGFVKYAMQRGKNIAIESVHRLPPNDGSDSIADGLMRARDMILLASDAEATTIPEQSPFHIPKSLEGEIKNAVEHGHLRCVSLV